MKYYIIAGEPSGDLHAANLMKSLKKKDPGAVFRCWGGDLMSAEGGVIVKHYKDLAFMGFLEVLMNIRTITRNLNFCKKDILDFQPDTIILVDYPGFNLRIARFAHESGIKVIYYISPQLWAWHESRVKTIRDNVDKMLVILPFEKDFYQKHAYQADFTGHPLLDRINEEMIFTGKQDFFQKNDLDERPVIALLPGSRKQEVKVMLRIMLSVKNEFPGHQFVVAGAPSLPETFYKDILGNEHVSLIKGQTYDLLHYAEAALVTSGTATLETALMNVPQVVCYKGNYISYLLARQLVKVKFISLVNLIMDEMIVKELIQDELTSKNLAAELKKILFDQQVKNKIHHSYDILKAKLGGRGASDRAADIITSYLLNP